VFMIRERVWPHYDCMKSSEERIEGRRAAAGGEGVCWKRFEPAKIIGEVLRVLSLVVGAGQKVLR